MKKNLKKVMVTGLVLANLFPIMPSFAATKDYDNHWAKDYIDTLVEKKIVAGYKDGSFKPNNKITREEVSSIVYAYMAGETTKKSKFEDVKGRWSEDAIAYLTEQEIIKGYPDGSFQPTKEITREEFSVIIYQYLADKMDLSKVEKKDFIDIDKSYAKEKIQVLAGLGIIDGYDGKEFRPGNDITRAEVAKVVADTAKVEENLKKDNKEDSEKTEVQEEDIKMAKKDLKDYLDTFNMEVLENKAIHTKGNQEGIQKLKELKQRAEELLADEDIDAAKLEEMREMPFKMVDGKKQKGSFNKLTKKFLVDFEVVGDRNVENKDNHKKYPKLEDQKIVIKTSLQDAKKKGENEDRFLKLNYISKDQYREKTEADVVSGATPRYKKQELPLEYYEVVATDTGYEFKINELPEDVEVLKPIVYVKLAEGTYFENGDLVYVMEDK